MGSPFGTLILRVQCQVLHNSEHLSDSFLTESREEVLASNPKKAFKYDDIFSLPNLINNDQNMKGRTNQFFSSNTPRFAIFPLIHSPLQVVPSYQRYQPQPCLILFENQPTYRSVYFFPFQSKYWTVPAPYISLPYHGPSQRQSMPRCQPSPHTSSFLSCPEKQQPLPKKNLPGPSFTSFLQVPTNLVPSGQFSYPKPSFFPHFHFPLQFQSSLQSQYSPQPLGSSQTHSPLQWLPCLSTMTPIPNLVLSCQQPTQQNPRSQSMMPYPDLTLTFFFPKNTPCPLTRVVKSRLIIQLRGSSSVICFTRSFISGKRSMKSSSNQPNPPLSFELRIFFDCLNNSPSQGIQPRQHDEPIYIKPTITQDI